MSAIRQHGSTEAQLGIGETVGRGANVFNRQRPLLNPTSLTHELELSAAVFHLFNMMEGNSSQPHCNSSDTTLERKGAAAGLI